MSKMQPRAIHTEEEYEAALARVAELMDATSAAEKREMETWAILIEDYEASRYDLPAPDPIAFLAFVMESRGLSQADLAKVLGSRARATEVLAGQRELSKDMIRRLSAAWGIPADALIGRLDAAA